MEISICSVNALITIKTLNSCLFFSNTLRRDTRRRSHSSEEDRLELSGALQARVLHVSSTDWQRDVLLIQAERWSALQQQFCSDSSLLRITLCQRNRCIRFRCPTWRTAQVLVSALVDNAGNQDTAEITIGDFENASILLFTLSITQPSQTGAFQ